MKSLVIILAIMMMVANVNSQNTHGVEEANGLAIGAMAPEFTTIDADSNTFNLAEALKSGPVVLLFYRGYWCTYCNKHLATVQDSLSLISEKGATVVAVSPQKPEYLEKMADKTGAKFRLLYDEAYKISDAYDVTFSPTPKKLFVYNTMVNAKLKETQSDESQRLPIPATYIIGKNGEIVWRHFNSDYKKRSTVKEIIENLDGL